MLGNTTKLARLLKSKLNYLLSTIAILTILLYPCLASAQNQSKSTFSDSAKIVAVATEAPSNSNQQLEKIIRSEVERQVKVEIDRLKSEIQLQFKTEALNNLGLATSSLGTLATILGGLVAVLTLGSILVPLLLFSLRGYVFRKLSSNVSQDILTEINKEKDEALKEIKKLKEIAKAQINMIYPTQASSKTQSLNEVQNLEMERANKLKEMKEYEYAIKAYQELGGIQPRNYEHWYKIACCYALLGVEKIDYVVENLAMAITLQPQCLDIIKQEPDFDTNIRSTEKFVKLLDSFSKNQ